MSWAAVGSAAIGGAASIGSSMLANSKKKKISSDYQGEKPMMPWQMPGWDDYYGTLKSRMSGQGVGFRPEVLSGATSAYAKQRRGALEGYELPAITSGASARGLGRSSVVTSQIGRAEQEAGRDIEERVAKMSLADEEQRRKEISDAISGMGSLIGTGVAASQARGNFAYDNFLNQQKLAQMANQESEKSQQRMTALGGTLAGTLLSRSPNSSSGNLKDIDSMLNSLGASTVNMNRQTGNGSDKSLLMNYLSGNRAGIMGMNPSYSRRRG